MIRSILIFVFLTILFTSCATNRVEKISQIKGEDHFGRQVVVDTTKKKATVVTFLSVRCPCSNSNAGHLKELVKQFPDFNFVIMHGNMNEPVDRSQKYFEKLDLKIPVVYDKDSYWTKKFDALKTPHTFIINNEGEVIYQGAVTDSTKVENAKRLYLKRALEAIRENKNPPMAETETLGCYIVRADEV